MKRILLITLALHTLTNFGHAQSIKEKLPSARHVDQESIYVHQNATFFLPGEHLLYKLYTINSNTNKLSDFSKIAYIELINSSKITIFKHKIRLESGQGQGDYLIPNTIPSGNYKIIAYTNWMKNRTQEQFFQSDISILNSFQNSQPNMVQTDSLLPTNSSKNTTKFDKYSTRNAPLKSELFSLSVSKQKLKQRAKVEIAIKALKNEPFSGNYSLSVRKIDELPTAIRSNSTSTNTTKKNRTAQYSALNEVKFIPELRGELLSGKVLSKNDNKPVADIKVSLSISGKQSILKIGTTNDAGIFYFNIHESYESNQAVLQIVHENRSQYRFEMEAPNTISFKDLQFFDFKINSEMKKQILDKHIQNQIEQVFSSIKTNTIKAVDSIKLDFNKISITYKLDDYTRFPTMRETIIEVIKEAIVKSNNGNRKINIRMGEQFLATDLEPLILIDGIIVQNHVEVLDLNMYSIHKINVVNEKFMFDSKTYEGIFSLESINGDYQTTSKGDFIKEIDLFKPQNRKKYFNQIYATTNELDRIPDYRNQLLWEPNLTLKETQKSLTFYTSDTKGTYEICMEGFTTNGTPISLKELFKVE